MSTLHIINRSPWSSDSWRRCLATLTPGDAILLIEDAVYAVTRDDLPANCFVLEPDLSARGLTTTSRTSCVNYAGFVDLVCQYARSISWT